MSSEGFDRREFLNFLGVASLSFGTFSSCKTAAVNAVAPPNKTPNFYDRAHTLSLNPSTKDDLLLAQGLSYEVILSYGDKINLAGDEFGSHNDFLAFAPLNDNHTEGVLWVNHEYHHTLFVHGQAIAAQDKTKAQVEKEMGGVGGSLVHIVLNKQGRWQLKLESPYNRRISALTPINFSNNHLIMGTNTALGTLANCAGGMTPYGTILSCEENYDFNYGEVSFADGSRSLVMKAAKDGWERFYAQPPEHYGWVVEINPFTGAAEKLVELGRMAHECATVNVAHDGRLVVYTGDDRAGEHLYKFISDRPGSLKSGTLYVAEFGKGQWIPLDLQQTPILQKHFTTQLELLIRCREAAKIVGATPLDRPEDIEIQPGSNAIFIACSNNIPKGNYFGTLSKVVESDNNPLSLTFSAREWLFGGEQSGIACPDNLAFDSHGNLWVTTDVSETAMHKSPYAAFGNNSLFMIPISGDEAGRPLRMASAPRDAELTGPLFSKDGNTLFLSVQHPGCTASDLKNPTSTWPTGNRAKSSVVAINGFNNIS